MIRQSFCTVSSTFLTIFCAVNIFFQCENAIIQNVNEIYNYITNYKKLHLWGWGVKVSLFTCAPPLECWHRNVLKGRLINWVLQNASTLFGQLGTLHICDWLIEVKQIYECCSAPLWSLYLTPRNQICFSRLR